VAEALQNAMEVTLENVPSIAGKIYVLPDVSGSMHSAVTGNRGTATTAVRCIDVAALKAVYHLANFVTRSKRSDRHECDRTYIELKVAGSTPAGRVPDAQ
jgi:hypothetical protein